MAPFDLELFGHAGRASGKRRRRIESRQHGRGGLALIARRAVLLAQSGVTGCEDGLFRWASGAAPPFSLVRMRAPAVNYGRSS